MGKQLRRTRALVDHPSHTPGGRAAGPAQPPARHMVRTDLPQLDSDGLPAFPAPASVPAPGEIHGGRGFSAVALVGHKGGSGKTTAAISIATGLVELGRRVLLVDTDPQASAAAWSEASAYSLRELPTVVRMGVGLQRPSQLPQLARAFDHVVIDCPPRGAAVVQAVLEAVDLALVPCGPSAVDAWALDESVALIRDTQRVQPGLRARIVITRKATGTALAQRARATLAECGLPLLSVELGYRVAYQEAMAEGRGVVQHAPRSIAAAEVRALVGELLSLPR